MNYNETSQWAADLGSGYSSIRPLGEGGMQMMISIVYMFCIVTI